MNVFSCRLLLLTGRSFVICAALSIASENGLAAAPESEAPGGPYAYSEAFAIENLHDSLTLVQGILAKTSPNPTAGGLRIIEWQNAPSLIDLCWIVIALGEHSAGSERLKKEFFEIKEQLGYLRVPYWVCSAEQHGRILSQYCFQNKFGPPDITHIREDQLVFRIVVQAEKQITARSGFKFEGYSGHIYLDL